MLATLTLLASLVLAQASEFPFGRFLGRVVASWDGGGRVMTLEEDFSYSAPDGVLWVAPRKSAVDGASIPRLFWTVIGGPFEGRYRDASVIHDVACVNRLRAWEPTHRAFYTAMRASGVRRMQAKIMFAAVWHFGPRWSDPKNAVRTCAEVGGLMVCQDNNTVEPRTLTLEGFNQLKAEIERRDAVDILGPPDRDIGMSLREIEGFASRQR